MWIQLDLVRQLMSAAVAAGDLASAMLFRCAYFFLSRVELLPVEYGGSVLTSLEDCAGGGVVVQCSDTEMRFFLREQMNARFGCTVARLCSCVRPLAKRPVHALGPCFRTTGICQKPCTTGICQKTFKTTSAGAGGLLL